MDTNVLVRSVVLDDRDQARMAAEALRDAELVALSLSSLCELFWVLNSVYRLKRQEIFTAILLLIDADNVVVDRPAAEAGLAFLEAGGDFADGLIAFEGRWMGGETFVSFDKRAVSLLVAQGRQAKLLS